MGLYLLSYISSWSMTTVPCQRVCGSNERSIQRTSVTLGKRRTAPLGRTNLEHLGVKGRWSSQ